MHVAVVGVFLPLGEHIQEVRVSVVYMRTKAGGRPGCGRSKLEKKSRIYISLRKDIDLAYLRYLHL